MRQIPFERPRAELRIEGQLEQTNGLVTWRFTSVDPQTGRLTDDPFVGILAPNTNPPAGEAMVFFTVTPRSPLNTGTVVTNQATIVFDQNSPIMTQVWTNTVDDTAPTSTILSLRRRKTPRVFWYNGAETIQEQAFGISVSTFPPTEAHLDHGCGTRRIPPPCSRDSTATATPFASPR